MAGLGGISVLQTYLPVIILFSLVMAAVNFLPAMLVSYRERGVLRRMSTTSVRPRTLLAAQILLNLALQVATAVLVVILAVAAFGATIGQPLGFIVAFALTAAALSAVGLLAAAVCFTGKAANAVGAVLFFVRCFSPGVDPPGRPCPPHCATSAASPPVARAARRSFPRRPGTGLPGGTSPSWP